MSTVELRHLTVNEQIWLTEKWVGKKFGKLTITKVVGKSKKNHQPYGMVKCECGNDKIINLGSLRGGNTKSCGCLRKEQIKRNSRSFGRYNQLIKDFTSLEKKYDSLKKENATLKSIVDNVKSILGSRLGIKSYIKREEERK